MTHARAGGRVIFPGLSRVGFTLLETVLAVAIFGLLAAGLYAVTVAALDSTRAAAEEQTSQERLESFFRAARNAFRNVPASGSVELRYAPGGSRTAEVVFKGGGPYFGIPSLAGGELILSARPMADGTRLFSLLKVPKLTGSSELGLLREGKEWIPLFARTEKVEWAFFADGEWRDEWPQGGRPLLARLRFERRDEGDSQEALFWIPPLQRSSGGASGDANRETPRVDAPRRGGEVRAQ